MVPEGVLAVSLQNPLKDAMLRLRLGDVLNLHTVGFPRAKLHHTPHTPRTTPHVHSTAPLTNYHDPANVISVMSIISRGLDFFFFGIDLIHKIRNLMRILFLH